MPEPVRLRARIHGFVQGVSFRYCTLRQAQGLGVNGYVRNRYDGTVEVVAEGQRPAVNELLSWLHSGPSHAQVDKVEYRWEEPQGDLGQFEVRF